MKTKLTLFLVVAGLLQAATGEAQLATGVTLTNLQGKVYNNITIDHTNKLGVIWKGADGGMGQIKYNELAMECWVKLNLSDIAKKYDEAIALQQEQEKKVRLAQAEAARQAAKQQAELTASAQTNSAQRQRQLEAEVAQMRAAGWMELTSDLIENFPEKVRDQIPGDGTIIHKYGWMDATFGSFNTYKDSPDFLGFGVIDSHGNDFIYCVVAKKLYSRETFTAADILAGALDNYTPNPLVNVAFNLKRGDKVRLIGHCDDSGERDSHAWFYIDRIEMIESAADAAAVKKAKEDLGN